MPQTIQVCHPSIKWDSRYRTGFPRDSLAYDRPICTCPVPDIHQNLLVKASKGKSIASKRWCLSEDKGSPLSQHWFFSFISSSNLSS